MTRISEVNSALSALLLGAAVAGCAFIEERLPGLTLSDSNVMGVVESLDKGEIDAAQLAEQKAASPKVRAFAARVLKEHRELGDLNKHLADELSIEARPPRLASELQTTHEEAMRKLRAISGPDFDRAYVAHEIEQHVRAFNFMQAAGDAESTLQLRQELVRTGPDLLSHISAARALARHLGDESPQVVASP